MAERMRVTVSIVAHRVVEGGRVEHPLAADEPCFFGRVTRHLKDTRRF
jgi:hypothetical protein